MVFAQTVPGESKTQNNDNSDTEKVDGNYYSDELDTAYKIVADGEKLIVKTNKTDFIPPLVARFTDGFADEAGFSAAVRFVRDKSNRVTGFS